MIKCKTKRRQNAGIYTIISRYKFCSSSRAAKNCRAGNNFLIDRWLLYDAVGSKFTSQQEGSIVPSRFTKSLRVTSSAATTPNSTDYYFVCQRIEGFNAADLGFGSASAQSITVSFWVRSSLTGTFSGSIGNASFNRAYPFTYSISSANTWEQKSVTIPGDTSGTWATDNTSGLQVVFDLGSGSSRQGTAGAWTSSDHRAVTGSVQVVATNGATFYITGVQLEPGTVATPFERRSYGAELMLAQRYYYKDAANDVHIFQCKTDNATTYNSTIRFPVTMRATPTCTATSGGESLFTSARTIQSQSADAVRISATTGGSAGNGYYFTGITASAEL